MRVFRYRYKRYIYDLTDYFEQEVEAKNKKEAYTKIFADYNGISFEKAEKSIVEILGENWSVETAIDWLNPLGSADLALYKINEIKEVRLKWLWNKLKFRK